MPLIFSCKIARVTWKLWLRSVGSRGGSSASRDTPTSLTQPGSSTLMTGPDLLVARGTGPGGVALHRAGARLCALDTCSRLRLTHLCRS